MKDLDTLINEYYRSQTLSDERIDAILAQTTQPQSKPRRRWLQLAAAAVVLLVSLTALHLYLSARSMTERVLTEIAMNHRQRLAMEVVTSDYAAVQNALNRLDFPLRPPASIGAGYELLGGRYCSIQGELAAQLKVRDQATGELRTLFATPLTSGLAGIAPLQTRHDRTEIRLWREQGIFYALAGD
jgi:anti-sigma factor RsiW